MLIQQMMLYGSPYLALAGLALFVLVLHFTLRRTLHRSTAAVKRDLQQVESQLARLRDDLSCAMTRIADAEERTGVLVPPPAPKSGLNLNRRTQVIRMSRRGDHPENIAASLGLPKQEVELLLKVHHLAVAGRVPVRSAD